jgi:hypothetical protein
MPRLHVVLLSLFSAIALFGQDRGTITGVITDTAGASVPEAKVTITNPRTGLNQSTMTGGDGSFSVPYLPVGSYTVAVEKAGFRKAEATGIAVNVTSTARVDIQLEVGQVQETVEVTGEAPPIVSERSDLGLVVNTKTINDLPLTLSGGLRDNLAFTILTPGVIYNQGDANTLRIGGGLSAGHSMLLDGAESNSERRNDAAFQAVSTDAIAEFKVITNGYSAEYGRTANGILNFTTKSGTNELHGSGFEYFRNEKLNARSFFSADRAIVRQNNFGGTLGGPVYLPKLYDGRNKAFWFFSYEKAIYRQGSPSGFTSIPPEALRNGDFSQWKDANGNVIPIYDPATTKVVGDQIVREQFPGNKIPAGRISQTAATINKYFPPTDLPTLFNNIHTVGNPGADQNVWSIKGDYAFTSNSRISGLFSRQFFGSPEQIGPFPGPLAQNFNGAGTNKFYRLNHDQVFSPTLLNHITFGWNKRDVIEFFSSRYYDIPEADRAIIALKGAVSTNITGNVQPPPAYNLGDGYQPVGFWIDTLSPSRTWQISEQLANIRGPHSLKFGFSFIRQDYKRFDCNGCAGQVDFDPKTTGLPGAAGQTGSAYAAFLLGLPSHGTFHWPGDFSFGQPYYAGFVQDDWKVNRRLTLNLGLRYELPFPKKESESRVSNLCMNCPNPAADGYPGALQFAGNGPGRTGQDSFLDVRKNAWGPRAGFAFQAFPTFVVRGGGGIFYVAEREGGNADRGTTGFGGGNDVTSPDGGVSPALLLDQGFPSFPHPPTIDPGLGLFGTVPFAARYAGYAPKMYDWNLTLEKGIGSSSVFRVSYQATIGVALLSNREQLNQVDPKYLSLQQVLFLPISSDAAKAAGIGKPFPSFPDDRSVAQALRPFPQYTGFDHDVDSDTTGHSTYHALTASFEHRYANGLWFLTSYTFSKLISNVQGENPGLGGFTGNGDASTQNAYDRRADKAISNQDVPHHLVLAYSYELPIGRGKKYLANSNAIAQGVFGGWKISGVHQYQTGYPLRVISTQDVGLYAGTIRANLITGVPLKNPAFNGDPNSAPYINPAAFQRPPNFTFGTSPANLPWLRSPGILSEDISLGKDFFLWNEGSRLEFKASAFNIANRVQFGGIDNTVEHTGSFGVLSSQVNRPREIQLSLRLLF